jgi:chromosome partitioning protein
MPVIAVLNPKGGCGKTTLAIHIARSLQLAGHSVLIVDTDPQASARTWSRLDAPDDVEPMPPVVGIDADALEREIPKHGRHYDFIVIDGAARVERLLQNAIKAADLVVIPTQPSPLDIWAVANLVEMVRTRQSIAGRPAAAFVVSRQVTGTRLGAEAGAALETYGLPVLEGRVFQRMVYAEALAAGATVFDADPGGKAAAEVDALVNELLRFHI